VDSTGSLFKTMDADSFHQCQRIDELWTCPNINQYDKRTRDNCLVSLYKSRSEDISRNCHLQIEQADDFIAQLNSTTFVLYLAEIQQIERVCSRHKSRGESSSVTANGLLKVQLAPGCKVITPSFVFEADENVFGDPFEVVLRMVKLDQILVPEISNDSLVYPKNLELITSKENITLPDSIQRLQHSHSSPSFLLWVLICSLAALGTLLCILVTYAIITQTSLRFCCRSSRPFDYRPAPIAVPPPGNEPLVHMSAV
jgi:hypothetical protein